MGGINMQRVLIGGIVAGLVIDIGEGIANLVLFAATFEATFADLGLPELSGATIGIFNLLGLVLGIIVVWMYAAMRPRLGAGAGTGACAGLLVWTLAMLFPTLFNILVGMFPAGTMVGPLIFSFVQYALAGVAGAYFYRED